MMAPRHILEQRFAAADRSACAVLWCSGRRSRQPRNSPSTPRPDGRELPPRPERFHEKARRGPGGAHGVRDLTVFEISGDEWLYEK